MIGYLSMGQGIAIIFKDEDEEEATSVKDMKC
jgi:hypothetical protein